MPKTFRGSCHEPIRPQPYWCARLPFARPQNFKTFRGTSTSDSFHSHPFLPGFETAVCQASNFKTHRRSCHEPLAPSWWLKCPKLEGVEDGLGQEPASIHDPRAQIILNGSHAGKDRTTELVLQQIVATWVTAKQVWR